MFRVYVFQTDQGFVQASCYRGIFSFSQSIHGSESNDVHERGRRTSPHYSANWSTATKAITPAATTTTTAAAAIAAAVLTQFPSGLLADGYVFCSAAIAVFRCVLASL